jgi:hypothetical protein
VPLISISIARPPFSRRSPTLIQIRKFWLESFLEEKHGVQDLNTYKKITLGKYWALHEKGAPRAIPTMCVLTIKKDKKLRPLRAKSRIVVLGNHKD